MSVNGGASKNMENSTEADNGGAVGHSAPSSPSVSRKDASALNVDSKIPRPSTLLASPTPLRRSGSLRLRGEKSGIIHSRLSPGRGTVHLTPRLSPGVQFPSITEACESWKTSLRGEGDGLSNSTLRRHRHHRSLQSLNTRSSSKDAYPLTPTPSPEDLDLLRPQNFNRFLLDHSKEFSGDQDDLDSLRSYGSNCSTQSACDHAQFARNGTTFSGRRMKYIVHCSSHPEPDEYLTPTQRANQQIRRLKALVEQARKDLEMKDENIFRLTKEVVELRLLRDEVDGCPAKTLHSSEDSTVSKVVTLQENEYGNSTSLSDSGHFDDVLSLTSAQSTLSPGPRQLMPTPETDRLAESYQRKIDDMTRRQGEKNLEDRKSLVEMYEKKMEEMSRRYKEKSQDEKKKLIEVYEKKMEDIAKRHQEKLHEKLSNQESFEKEIGEQNKSLQSLIKKLEESQHMGSIAEENVMSLNQQLDAANLRCHELQQELFQSRERAAFLEEEVETLQKTLAQLKQEMSEQQLNLSQSDELESELQLLRAKLEEQKPICELNVQLESELARVLNILKDEEQKSKTLELKLAEVDALCRKECRKVSDLKSQQEDELARVMNCLKDEEQKNKLLECRVAEAHALLEEEYEKCAVVKTQLESELAQMVNCLKDEEIKNKELELWKDGREKLHNDEHKQTLELNSQLECKLQSVFKNLEENEQKYKRLQEEKAEVETAHQAEMKQAFVLKSELEGELVRMRHLLLNEEEKNRSLEQSQHETLTLKEDECRKTLELMAQLKSELVIVKNRSNEEDMRSSELEQWKMEAQTLEGKLAKYIQQVISLTDHSANLENKVYELTNTLSEERKKMQAHHSKVQDLEDHCQKFQKEAEEQLKQVQYLTNHIAEVEEEMRRLSKLLDEKKEKSEDSLQWKDKAKELEVEILCLKESVAEKSEQLQYLSSIESELILLKNNLALESQKEEELDLWKSKARDLEEKISSLLNEETMFQNRSMKVEEELSNSITEATLDGIGSTHTLENMKIHQRVSDTAQQYTHALEAEIGKLKESLDQSYWVQSEKETAKLEMEKKVIDQDLLVKKLETELTMLNQRISELQQENGELRLLRQHSSNSEIKAFYEDGTFAECNKMNEELSHELNPQQIHGEIQKQEETKTTSQLRSEIEALKKALVDQEERHSDVNLKMYLKGQEAAKFERKDQVLEMAVQAPEKVSIPELLTQLAETEKELDKVKDNQLTNMPNSSLSLLSASEAVCLYLLGSFKAMCRQLAEGQAHSSSSPEATLLFLKSAFYYFLTDEANCQGHLHAIQSILGFTESEKQTIDTLTYIRR